MYTLSKQSSTTCVGLVILGKPGAGKSKFSKWLSNKLELTFLDMGELIRTQLKEHAQAEISDTVTNGGLISTQFCIDILKTKLFEQSAKKRAEQKSDNGFILVGFPRTLDQLTQYHNLVELFPTDTNLYLHLDVADSVAQSRALARRQKAARQGKLRDDDTEVIFAKRLSSYYQTTQPLIEHLVQTYSQQTIQADAFTMKKREIYELVMQVIQRA